MLVDTLNTLLYITVEKWAIVTPIMSDFFGEKFQAPKRNNDGTASTTETTGSGTHFGQHFDSVMLRTMLSWLTYVGCNNENSCKYGGCAHCTSMSIALPTIGTCTVRLCQDIEFQHARNESEDTWLRATVVCRFVEGSVWSICRHVLTGCSLCIGTEFLTTTLQGVGQILNG